MFTIILPLSYWFFQTLALHDLVVELPATYGEADEFCPLVIRISGKLYYLLSRQDVDYTLHALPRQAHLAGNLRVRP